MVVQAEGGVSIVDPSDRGGKGTHITPGQFYTHDPSLQPLRELTRVFTRSADRSINKMVELHGRRTGAEAGCQRVSVDRAGECAAPGASWSAGRALDGSARDVRCQ